MAKRIFAYWGRKAVLNLALLIGIVAFYMLIWLFVGLKGNDRESIFTGMAFYALAIGAVFLICSSFSTCEYDIPLTISMGSLRRDAFWGTQVMMLLMVMETSLFVDFLLVLSRRVFAENTGFFLAAVWVVNMLAACMGQISLTLCLRYGKKGAAFWFVAIILLFCGAVVTLLKDFGDQLHFRMDFRCLLHPVVPVAVILFYLAGAAAVYHVLKEYEVRR